MGGPLSEQVSVNGIFCNNLVCVLHACMDGCSGQIYMKDAECAESKDHDSDFSYFNFRVIVIIVLKIWSVFDEF